MGYALLLAAGAVTLAFVGPSTARAMVAASSTDVAHLTRDPWLVLPASALWAGANLPFWVLLSLVGMGAAEHALGARRTLAVAAVVHVVPTLLTQGGVAVLVATGRLPAAAEVMLDVGPSYLLLGVGACAVVVTGWPWRGVVLALVAFAGLPLVAKTGSWGLAEWGHASALLLGLGCGVAAGRPGPRPAPHTGAQPARGLSSGG